LKPGLTSRAALKYFNEEELLKQQKDPSWFNDHVIFLDKVELNLDYYYHRSFWGDIKIIIKSVSFILNE
jgi:lipopolysaccharide/colanic/teichoic acid biosynthesis glycosyltransferase